MSAYDHAVVLLYLAFVVCIGLVFRGTNKDSSDYFRCGGRVVWWMVGATAFMTQFSSWTFTGAASRAYTDGTSVLVIYFGNALGYFSAFLWSAAYFRQMRVVTPMEGVRDRFGAANEQFFTWCWIPLGIIYAGIWLNATSTFAGTVFGVDQSVTIVVIGLVVLLTAAVGGGSAVVASDFIQMVILFPVAVVVAFLAIQAVGDGDFSVGLSDFISRLGDNQTASTAAARPTVLVLWVAATLLKQFCTTNNMNDSHRFLLAVDSRSARRAALMAAVLFLLGPIIWFVPPIAASIIYPDLSTIPRLQQLGDRVTEGAYLAVGINTLPTGMIGLMAAALFGVTMSNMDTGLNKSAGIFIRNFYKPILRQSASEKEYVIAGQLSSVVCGMLVITVAMALQRSGGFRLFDVMMLFSSMAVIPFILPLIWGMVIRRTPDWSGWSTVCVTLLASSLSPHLVDTLFERGFMGSTPPLRGRETADILFAMSLFINVAVGSAWFVGSSLFARFSSTAQVARQDDFYIRARTPVVSDVEEASVAERMMRHSLSRLCIPYGCLVMAFALIPNPFAGRLMFVFCGGSVAAVGLLLRPTRTYRPEVRHRDVRLEIEIGGAK